MSEYDVIIVGAGHNGLTAGVELQRAGHRVLILEKTNWPGGQAATKELFKGFKHSVGAWALLVFREEMIRHLELDREGFELLRRDHAHIEVLVVVAERLAVPVRVGEASLGQRPAERVGEILESHEGMADLRVHREQRVPGADKPPVLLGAEPTLPIEQSLTSVVPEVVPSDFHSSGPLVPSSAPESNS